MEYNTDFYNDSNNKKLLTRAVLIVVFSLILIFSLLGEKVAINNGIGWDGMNYLRTIQSFTDLITTHGYDQYAIQRIMPWGLVNIIFRCVDIDTTPENALRAAGLINVFVLFLSVLYFFKISTLKKWKISTEIVAFSSLFF